MKQGAGLEVQRNRRAQNVNLHQVQSESWPPLGEVLQGKVLPGKALHEEVLRDEHPGVRDVGPGVPGVDPGRPNVDLELLQNATPAEAPVEGVLERARSHAVVVGGRYIVMLTYGIIRYSATRI